MSNRRTSKRRRQGLSIGFLALCAALVGPSVAGCKKDDAAPSPNTPASSTDWGDKIKIKTTDKAEFLSVQQAGGRIKLKSADGTVKGRTKGAKTTYENDQGKVVAVAKDKDDGFKVKGADEKLWAKVKRRDGGLKICLDEECATSFKVNRYDDKVKVKRGEEELGVIKIYDEKLKAKRLDMTLFEIKGTKQAVAFTPLLVEGLDETARRIVIAELIRRGM